MKFLTTFVTLSLGASALANYNCTPTVKHVPEKFTWEEVDRCPTGSAICTPWTFKNLSNPDGTGVLYWPPTNQPGQVSQLPIMLNNYYKWAVLNCASLPNIPGSLGQGCGDPLGNATVGPSSQALYTDGGKTAFSVRNQTVYADVHPVIGASSWVPSQMIFNLKSFRIWVVDQQSTCDPRFGCVIKIKGYRKDSSVTDVVEVRLVWLDNLPGRTDWRTYVGDLEARGFTDLVGFEVSVNYLRVPKDFGMAYTIDDIEIEELQDACVADGGHGGDGGHAGDGGQGSGRPTSSRTTRTGPTRSNY